jgi:protein-L-isoaspartate(D-aspartate) O-methyltransferase
MRKPLLPQNPEHLAKLRAFYARYVAARGHVADRRIIEAFEAVRREDFAGPGPWFISVPRHGYIETPDSDVAYLYQDTLVAIDMARGINIGEPSLHALCLDALKVKLGETVLHIGAGTGYYSAILAQLVGPAGRVHAFEIEPDLAARAARNLAHLPWVTVEARSGLDAELPPADVIYVNAGLPQPARSWLAALRPGGRLSFPFQPSDGFGGMLQIERPSAGASWPARIVTPAGFIGCQGGQDEAASGRLAEAMERRGLRTIRSLRLDATPDATCWLAGQGWWLSTVKPAPDG